MDLFPLVGKRRLYGGHHGQRQAVAEYNKDKETITLKGLRGNVAVTA